MKKTLFYISVYTLLAFPCFAQKETVLLRKINATNAVESTRPVSLNAYLESLPTHFINYLNQTGRYAVIDLNSVFSESNLDLELENSAVFEVAEKKLLKKPKYILNCSVTAFVEKQVKVKNPLDDSMRINRDIFVSATMQLVNRDNPADQKTFQAPDFSDSWDEDVFGSSNAGYTGFNIGTSCRAVSMFGNENFANATVGSGVHDLNITGSYNLHDSFVGSNAYYININGLTNFYYSNAVGVQDIGQILEDKEYRIGFNLNILI